MLDVHSAIKSHLSFARWISLPGSVFLGHWLQRMDTTALTVTNQVLLIAKGRNLNHKSLFEILIVSG